MLEPLPATAASSSKRTLRRAAYIGATLFGYLASVGCSSGELPSEEELGSVSQAVKLAGSATASSALGGNVAANAVDANAGSRWESAHGVDPQWLTVDLGTQKAFDRVYLSWEGAYATAYTIQQSNDNVNFSTLFTTTTGNGGIDDITGLNGNARYVRMHGTVRALPYGYSLYEMEVHQTAAACQSNDLMTSATLPMTASSGTASLGADNNAGTRWESSNTDPQWIRVDLGATMKINRVLINWETASAKDYTVQVSNDGTNFTTIATRTNMPAGANRVDDLTGLDGTGRYLRVYGTSRTTGYGYSIWELSAFGDTNPNCGGSSCTPTTCGALGATCGTPSDGCGGTLSCGTCSGGQTCNASNQCVSSCTPTTCAALGATCGTPSDGCGGTLSCGTCSGGQTCNASNQCVGGGGGGASCVKIRSQRTNNYLFNNAGLVTPGATVTAAEVFEKIPEGSGFRFKATSNNTFVGITGDDLAVNGTAVTFTEHDCSSGGTYPNGKGYASPSGTGPNWKANSTTGAIDTNNGGNGGTCANGSAGSWERFYVESATCPSAPSESCNGTCAMGQNCVNNVCVAPTAGYYNSGKSLQATPDFGPNVKVYTPASNPTTVQNEIEAIYAIQHTNQFGSQRHAILFTPGAYSTHLPIGFNTQIAGLGDHPDAVDLSGWLEAPPDFLPSNNGTQTFWRFVENFKSSHTANVGCGTGVATCSANMLWAVSQAAPMRRVHVTGSVDLHRGYGWQSGGFMADTVIDGHLLFGSQQQWYTRNSHIANAVEGTWNIMFQGVTGTKHQPLFPTNAQLAAGDRGGPRTDLANAPVIREKPFVYVNRDGIWKVFVPALRTNASGPTWTGTQQGTSIPLTSFHIAKAGTDTAATMNAALASGKHLLVTPGVYNLSAPLAINNANTVVLGMGLATLIPNNGVKAVTVADVPGVKLAGILVDAGTGNSPVLVEVGPAGSSANHAANPTSIHDIFTRIGGMPWLGRADQSLVVNSRNVIIDHVWLWRADHGDTPGTVGWTLNTAKNGLVVNGNDVTAYGTHVEHFQEYQVIWNGNNGRNYFFQNEMPYEAPNQTSLDDPPAPVLNPNSGKGYAAYKVADGVVNHMFIGGGCYSVFTMNECTQNSQCASGVCDLTDNHCTAPNPIMQEDRCIEAPAAQMGVNFQNVIALSLIPKGQINNLINSDGKAAGPGDFATFPKLGSWR